MAKSFLKRRRNDLLYLIIKALLFALRFLPRKAGLVLFGFVGRLFYVLPTLEKQRTRHNLKKIYPEWSDRRIRQTSKSIYCNLGKNLYDTIYLTICSNRQFFDLVKHNDLSAIKKAYENGKGVVALSGHIGCFESTIHVLARNGIKCVTIGQSLYDQRVTNLITGFRERNNITYLHRDGSGREIIKLLKKGFTFGALLDQDTDIDGVFTNFLGLPAYTPSGPIRLAMRFNIPVFVAVTTRKKDNTHDFYLNGPLTLEDSGNFNRDLVVNTQKVSDILSDVIRKTPDQWVWMHRRWKTQPSDEKYKDVPNIENYQQRES